MKKIEDVKIGDRFVVTPELNGFWAGEGVVSYETTAGNKYVSLRMTTGKRKGDVGGFLYSELKEPASINPGFVIGAPLPTFKVGDKVKILRKAALHENGWGNSWVSDMDKEVGKIGEVNAVFDQEKKKDVQVRTDTGNWGYPVFALELQTGRALRVGDYVKVSGKKAYGWDGEGTVYSLFSTNALQGIIGVEMKSGNFKGTRGGFSQEAVSLTEAPEQAPIAPTPKHLDYLGQEIKVGSFIVYPGRQGSSLYVNLGIVKKLTNSREKATLLIRGAKNTANSILTQINRAVVVPRESVPVATRTRLEA